MNVTNKKIGIWGYGVSGKAAVAYFLKKKISSKIGSIIVMDKKIDQQDLIFFIAHDISFMPQTTHTTIFLDSCDYIVPSQGIDLRLYKKYSHKWLSELDLFISSWHHPVIAITGTIGKTTVTHFLGNILHNAFFSVAIGGNIGTCMLDFIDQQDIYNYGVVEVSSFQLELCKHFSPDLAIITNIYPNHLDRHDTMDCYISAKKNILSYQKEHQKALLPLYLKDHFTDYKGQSYFFHDKPLTSGQLDSLGENTCFYLDTHNNIVKYAQDKHNTIVNYTIMPHYSFKANWLIIASVLDILNQPHDLIKTVSAKNQLAHRLQKIETVNYIDIYNDSKSTVPQSTIAAVDTLQGKPILLLLGGISKGVDRSSLIAHLKHKVTAILCFGAEAQQLYLFCNHYEIPASYHTTLEEAFLAAVNIAKPYNQILLSPAGASYDLYANYQERGDHFKQLVTAWALRSYKLFSNKYEKTVDNDLKI